jgi:integrase/recombinase XerD
MLVLWRRHAQECPHDSRDSRKCACPIWFDWRIGGKRIRKPMKTKDWQVAQIKARQMEAEGIVSNVLPLTLEQATEKFLQDAKARGLKPPSLYKYKLVLKQLKAFSEQRAIALMSAFSVDDLRAFRASWVNKNLSASKKLEHLKAFFKFSYESGWIKENPAKGIKPPKIDDPPVLPFSDEEMKKILKACDTHSMQERAIQLRGLVLLMRHSGLRIGDACTLNRARIDKGTLELYTAKSGTKVRLPINPVALQALGKIPKNSEHYFWSGKSTRKTCINIWEDTFKKMFQRAGIDGHSHQLRHTFAVGLLQKGASMENVSLLLGHRRIAVTEKYYASFTKGRQDSLDLDVRKTWE